MFKSLIGIIKTINLEDETQKEKIV